MFESTKWKLKEQLLYALSPTVILLLVILLQNSKAKISTNRLPQSMSNSRANSPSEQVRKTAIGSRRASLFAAVKKPPVPNLDESIRVVNKHKLLSSQRSKKLTKLVLNKTSIKGPVEIVNVAAPPSKNISIKLKPPIAFVGLHKKIQSHRGSNAEPAKKSHRASLDLSSKNRGISPATGQGIRASLHNTPKSKQKLDVSKILSSALKIELDKRQPRPAQRSRVINSRGVSGGSAEKPARGTSRENDKVINVSIHHNFNNICYAPIYIKQQYKAAAEDKRSTKPSANSKKKAKGDYTQLANCFENLENNKLSETHIEQIAKSIDPLAQDREKLVRHNKLWFKNNEEVPRTTPDYYNFLRLIGKGAFGKVTLGVHKLTGKYVAIKTIEKKYMKDEFSRRKVFQEVYILKKIRHANVIRLLEVFEDQNHMLIVMEYAAGGDLLKYVRTKGALPESEARYIFRQVVYGLGHIHARSVLHRDIKLDNILLDKDGGVKICDFGVSKIIAKTDVVKEQCGTPAYIAPEVITNEGYTGFFIDHWSLGVLLYAMLCANVPFKAKNMQELLQVIRTTPVAFPIKVTDAAADLIMRLLQIDPEERLSIPEILAHEWMQEELREEDSSAFVNSGDFADQEEPIASINIVNMDNLFFRGKGKEKLSYTEYCAIGNDMYTFRIEESVLKMMEELGYPRKVVIEGIQKGELNHATATYNLLVLP